MDSNQKETRLHPYILKQWLADQKHLLYFHLLFFLLFNSILLLSAPFKATSTDLLYLDLLYCCFFSAYLLYTYVSYRRCYWPLLKALATNQNNLLFYLPEVKTPTTRLIHKIAHGLYKEHTDLQQQLMRTLVESEDYASIWAHEIKSPLAIMSMSLQGCDDEQLKADLIEELERVHHLVDQALNYNRSTSFSRDFLVCEVAPAKLFSTLLKKHARILIFKQLSVELQPSDYCGVTDKKWLMFILEQLLVNAIKYSPSGGKITCYFEEDDHTFKIMVQDEGIGIQPEDLPRIFDRGFTGQNGRQFGTSTGMGLFLAKRVSESLGHSIHAESHPQKGSRFTVTLSKFGADRLNLTRL